MSSPIKNVLAILAVIFSSFTFYPAIASHLQGADVTYTFLGMAGSNYQYQVSVTIYEDCFNGDPTAIAQDNPAYMVVYDGNGNFIRFDSSYAVAVSIPLVYDSTCTNPPAMCLQKRTFVVDYDLPPNTSGYVVAYQRCCMSAAILNLLNPGSTGMTAWCTIPPAPNTNNSAVFNNYPSKLLVINKPFTIDFSAKDADGDSLSYGLCSAYTGGSDNDAKPVPGPPPYTPVDYAPSYSYSNPMSCSIPLTIDPVTGLLTGTPNLIGQYLVDVCCHEWRSGVMINTVTREFKFIVSNCMPDTTGPPATFVPPNELEVFPNPATTEITIASPDTITQITIYNVPGQTLFSREYNHAQEVQVDISDFCTGMYFIKISGPGNRKVRKFVKQHYH